MNVSTEQQFRSRTIGADFGEERASPRFLMAFPDPLNASPYKTDRGTPETWTKT